MHADATFRIDFLDWTHDDQLISSHLIQIRRCSLFLTALSTVSIRNQVILINCPLSGRRRRRCVDTKISSFWSIMAAYIVFPLPMVPMSGCQALGLRLLLSLPSMTVSISSTTGHCIVLMRTVVRANASQMYGLTSPDFVDIFRFRRA